MKEFLLLIAMMCQVEDRTIYVVVDNNENSKILKSELTRDWTAGKRTNEICEDLNCHRIELSSKLKIIDRFNPNERKQYRVPDLDVYPAYRVGVYRRFESFPPETFTTTSFPLLTTISLQHNMYVDMYDWKKRCQQKLYDAKVSHLSKLGEWMFKVDVNVATSIFVNFHNECCEIEDIIREVERTHGKKPGYPKFAPLKIVSPLIPFPWEPSNKFEQTLEYFSVVE